MYYHIQITTKENEKINKFDVVDLEYIKSNILIPYLKGNHSNLAGYVIAAADVKRIDVTKSKDKSSECVNIADSKRPLSATTTILPETCVFDNENFSTDITDELLDELRKNTSIIKSPSVFDLASKISGFSDEFLELKRCETA